MSRDTDDFVAELSAKDLSRMTGLSERAITKRCQAGAYPGAHLQHGRWLIPVPIPVGLTRALAPLQLARGGEVPLPAEAVQILQSYATQREVRAALEPHHEAREELERRIDAIHQAHLVAEGAAAAAARRLAAAEGEVARLAARVAQLEEALGQLTAEVARQGARGGGLKGLFRAAHSAE